MPEPLLGRPLLEYLGPNTAEILAVAADRAPEDSNAGLLDSVSTSVGAGRFSRVLKGVFHADGDGDAHVEDGLNADFWYDLGPKTKGEWESHLQARLRAATKAGLSPRGAARLEVLLRKYREAVRVRLDGRPPAKVNPLSIKLIPSSISARAKPRRYPSSKTRILAQMHRTNCVTRYK